jgi:predicted DNA-binding protein (MmcQ/YjbR family)
MNHKQVEKYLLSLPETRLEYPFGKQVAVYKVGSGDFTKMFALIAEGKDPVNLSLKCDPVLAKHLRQKYETVLEGYHLNKKHWNTLILSGQLTWQDVQDLIMHSYNLVTNTEQDTAIKELLD